MSAPANFDFFADTYDADLDRALKVSGESKEYFLEGRIAWLSRRLREFGCLPETILDFGCGTGLSVPVWRKVAPDARLVGIDVSSRSLAVARQRFAEAGRFYEAGEYVPREECDLVYANGVFHHVLPSKRAEALDYVRQCLRPGGMFALWENNPINPGTRWVMARCSFDRDAHTIRPGQARRMLQSAGFDVLGVDFLFFFPRLLSWLRPLEPALRSFPLGAQYLVLGRRD